MSNIFDQFNNNDVFDLIAQYPLAIMLSQGRSGFISTSLPILAYVDQHGAVDRLIGHIALSNPHVDELKRSNRANFLFQGPNHYISPTLISNRSWSPTWNYIRVSVEADVTFIPRMVSDALEQLVSKMEAGRENAWSISEMGDRYQNLSQHILAFQAEIKSINATFKLGQDENPIVFDEIIAGLGDSSLSRWMLRFSNRTTHVA